jgi:3-oxoacyl-[acyl-carrier-protein] synthase II
MSATVAITGIGIVGPTGLGIEALWTSLMEHRSGIVRLEGEEYEGLPARHAAPIADFDLSPHIEKRAARRMGRFAQFALVAGDLALTDAGLTAAYAPIPPPFGEILLGAAMAKAAVAFAFGLAGGLAAAGAACVGLSYALTRGSA